MLQTVELFFNYIPNFYIYSNNKLTESSPSVIFSLPHETAVPSVSAGEVVLARVEPVVAVGLAQRHFVEPLLAPRLSRYLAIKEIGDKNV